MSKKHPKGCVEWLLPGKKRPFANSTLAAKLLVDALAIDGGTVRQVMDSIVYDLEAKEILQVYVNKGFGDTIASELFG